MSLETPIKIRMLQRKLYQKAKEEPNYRFYLLYDKMYREDLLAHAYALAKSNQGAPRVDGQSFRGIEALGLEEWLSGIRNDLRAKTYQPQAVRRVMIPKPGGGQRPLGWRNKPEIVDLWKTFAVNSLTTDTAEVRINGDTAVVLGTQTEDGDHML